LQQKTTHTEAELFHLTSEGNETAFREIFELYGRLLYPFLFRTVKSQALAEELIQETMLKVWLSRDKLPGIEHPRSWIFRIAANLAYTHLRRQVLEEKVKGELSRHDPGYDDPEATHNLNELKRHVREAVHRLPTERRRIYLLSREGGLSRDEIAEQLQISPSTVKNAIYSALKDIREHLEKTGYTLPLFCIPFIKL